MLLNRKMNISVKVVEERPDKSFIFPLLLFSFELFYYHIGKDVKLQTKTIQYRKINK